MKVGAEKSKIADEEGNEVLDLPCGKEGKRKLDFSGRDGVDETL